MDPQALLELYGLEGRQAAGAAWLNRVEHAWQCARLARNAGAAPSLQLAAWLHELGDLMAGHPATAAPDGPDQTLARSETGAAQRAAAVLQPLFGDTVSEPIALRLQARRCLASTKPDFRRRLSAAELEAVEREGGLQSAREARAFLQRPYAPQAIKLCLWDMDAHDPTLRPPSLEGVLDTLRRLMWLLQASEPLRTGTWLRTPRPTLRQPKAAPAV